MSGFSGRLLGTKKSIGKNVKQGISEIGRVAATILKAADDVAAYLAFTMQLGLTQPGQISVRPQMWISRHGTPLSTGKGKYLMKHT